MISTRTRRDDECVGSLSALGPGGHSTHACVRLPLCVPRRALENIDIHASVISFTLPRIREERRAVAVDALSFCFATVVGLVGVVLECTSINHNHTRHTHTQRHRNRGGDESCEHVGSNKRFGRRRRRPTISQTQRLRPSSNASEPSERASPASIGLATLCSLGLRRFIVRHPTTEWNPHTRDRVGCGTAFFSSRSRAR